MDNLPYFLAFHRMQQVGPRTLLRLKELWPDWSSLFHSNRESLERAGIPTKLAHHIATFDFKAIEEDLRWAAAFADNHLLTPESPEYPNLLKEIADPPIVLYAQGCLTALKQPILAMVGSRKPSVTGKEDALYFAKNVAKLGITIASGLALGIDAAAHQGSMEAGGYTIAVLGTGIESIYPRCHGSLAEKIRAEGLLLSEFPLKTPVMARHFPRRNRIISGLAKCTLVVEAALKSGSLITAHMAVEQNRDVLAIPSSIHNTQAQGCHYLLQQGAKLVTSVQDVLDEFGLHQGSTPDKPALPLASEGKNLVQFIGFELTSVDQIKKRSGYTIEQILGYLAQLEIQGTVAAVPGGYIRV